MRIAQADFSRCRLGWSGTALLLVGILTASLSGPVGAAADKEDTTGPAARKKSTDSMKTLALAFHSYADDHKGEMPPAAVYNRDGKALYSWRVLVLPYLGEKKLFDQFKLDEPWDSDNNKKLVEKMPDVFAPLEGDARKANSTFYQVFTGPETPFTQKDHGPRIPNSFPDGTSNTILIVEGGEAVPWSAPRELSYDGKKPIPKLGGQFTDGFHAALADGSVRFIKKGKLTEATLRSAINPADGLPLGRDWD